MPYQIQYSENMLIRIKKKCKLTKYNTAVSLVKSASGFSLIKPVLSTVKNDVDLPSPTIEYSRSLNGA